MERLEIKLTIGIISFLMFLTYCYIVTNLIVLIPFQKNVDQTVSRTKYSKKQLESLMLL